MPTYEYQCKQCSHVFDVFQSITASPLRKAFCEHCGQKQSVKRLIGTGGAILFKGSGFYQTDYRSAGYNKAAKAEKTSKAGGDSSPKGSKEKSSKQTPASDKKSKTTQPTPPSDKSSSPSKEP